MKTISREHAQDGVQYKITSTRKKNIVSFYVSAEDIRNPESYTVTEIYYLKVESENDRSFNN